MRVAVGLSGGVDSAMAAYLLKQQGHDVVALTMQIWDGSLPLPDEGRSGCYGPGEVRDLAAARAVAQRLGIAHHTIALAPEYKAHVLEPFRREYLCGRTPNPCVRCNRLLKFGLLLERARAEGVAFETFATGHYARVEFVPARDRFLLKRGRDAAKDQSYFLAGLAQETLRHVLFPLGELWKGDVKRLAADIGWLDLAARQESQDFIESRHYGVLFREGDATPGPIVDAEGRVLGQHRGIVHYTVGQRKGLGLGGTGAPLFVIRIDAPANAVVVGRREALYGRALKAVAINWISGEAPEGPLRVTARIRQQHRAASAVLTPADGVEPPGAVATVEFDDPQMAITPGQTVVFYREDEVLGGGRIAG